MLYRSGNRAAHVAILRPSPSAANTKLGTVCLCVVNDKQQSSSLCESTPGAGKGEGPTGVDILAKIKEKVEEAGSCALFP
jgi:hypothetical protein